MKPHRYHRIMDGSISLKTELVYPQCTVNGAGTIYRNASNNIYLSAAVVGNEVDFFYYKWTCYLENGIDECGLDVQTSLTTITNYTIIGGTLSPKTTYIYKMQVVA